MGNKTINIINEKTKRNSIDKNGGNNNDNNLNTKNIIINNNTYINFDLINKYIKKLNIFNNEIDIIDVIGDGNCFMRCIAIFVYMDENSHLRVRSEIVNYLLSNWRNYENITLQTEEGDKSIIDYINWIKIPGRWSGNIEFIAAYKLYNINILLQQKY